MTLFQSKVSVETGKVEIFTFKAAKAIIIAHIDMSHEMKAITKSN